MARETEAWSRCLLVVVVLLSLHLTDGQTISVTGGNVIAIRGVDDHIFNKFCSVDITTNVMGFQWFREGTLVEDDIIPGMGRSNLRIPNNKLTTEDNGEYFCRVLWNDGSESDNFTAGRLTVLENDVIEAPPIQYGILGNDVELQCRISSSAGLTIFDTWSVGGSTIANNILSSVDETHERTYTCILNDSGGEMEEFEIEINFKIAVPPVIDSTLPSDYTFTGDEFHTISVSYSGRNETTTSNQWTKDGQPLPITGSNYMIETTFSDTYKATTSLTFTSDPIPRSLSGQYTVTITNTNDVIPVDMMTATHSFYLSVKVYPAMITDLKYSSLSPTSTNITWTVDYRYPDEHPDNLTILLKNIDTGVEKSYLINSAVTRRSSEVEVVPGTQYSVTLESANQDGINRTDSLMFTTEPTAPSVRELNVTRINSTSFELTATLHYTGGGSITKFNVSFRVRGEAEWSIATVIPVDVVSNSNQLQWTGIINDQQFNQFEVFEFRLRVANSMEFISPPLLMVQPLVLPDPPVRIEAISTTTTSAVIEIELSSVGTAPLVVIVELTSHPEIVCCDNQTTYIMGDTVRISIEGLSKDTTYTINVYAQNLEGRGSGKQVSFSTDGDVTTLELWQAVLIGVCGAIVLGILLVLFCILLGCGCKASKKWGRKEYHTGPIEMGRRELDRGDPMLSRSYRSNGYSGYAGSQISYGSNQGRPLTPRTPTGMSVTSPSFDYTDAPKYDDLNTSRVSSSISPFHATSRDKLTQVSSVSHSNLYYPTYHPHDFANEVNYQSLPRGMDAGYQFGSSTLSPPPAPAHLSTDV